MIAFIIIPAFLLFFMYPLLKNKLEVAYFWKKGNVPPRMTYTVENLTLVYIALAGLLIKQHAVQKHQKLTFLYKYIITDLAQGSEITGDYQEIKGALIYSINHPIKLNSVSKWLISKNITEAHKMMILKFMADLAYIDKQIHPRELALIKEFSKLLSVPDRQLNAIVNPLRQDHEKRATNEQQQRKQAQQRIIPKPSERERCCNILRVSKEAKFDEIKKSYRKLVLLYHPDKFVNAAPSEYNSAQKKFLEIQSAYEILEKQSHR